MSFKGKFLAVTLVSAMTLSVYTPALAAENSVAIQVNGVKSKAEAVMIDSSAYIKADEVNAVLGLEGVLNNGKYIIGKTIIDTNKTADGEYLGIRALAEAADYMIGWDGDNNTVVIVDTGKLGNESFNIIKNYIQKTAKVTAEGYKTTGSLSGKAEIVDETTITVPFSAEITGETNSNAANADIALKMDISEIYNMASEDGSAVELSDVESTVIAAIEDSNTKIIYDAEGGKLYLKSSLLTVLGLDENTWLSLNYSSLMEMTGTEDLAMNTVMKLAENGDFESYLLSVLKAMPIDSVDSYDAIKEAYDTVSGVLGDSSFKNENGKCTSEYSVNEDGKAIESKLVIDDNAFTMNMKISADGTSVELTASNDSNLNSETKLTIDMAGLIKLYVEYKATVTAAEVTPLTAPAGGENVIDLADLFGGLFMA